jgi:hypothetical protein
MNNNAGRADETKGEETCGDEIAGSLRDQQSRIFQNDLGIEFALSMQARAE